MFSYRQTWAEVSLDAIAHNVKAIKAGLRPSTRFMAVVKADGYGHGAVQIAKAALEAGADWLGVALLDEALQLRAAGIDCPILVLGYMPPASVEAAVKHRIAITVFARDDLDTVIESAARLRQQADVHLKADTGMTRLGVTDRDEALDLARTAASSPWVRLEGIFTHFASADSPDETYTRGQFRTFLAMIEHLERNGIRVPVKHCCNSAATLRFPEMHLGMVRVGISLYGLSPYSGPVPVMPELLPAMRWKTRVASLKQVPAGQPIGYGCTYRPERPSLIATVPVGYADGLSRRLSNRGGVWIGGRHAPIVGRVCMDQTMVDVSAVPGVRTGDEAILFGCGEDGCLPVEEMASLLDTIHYELVCTVGKRVPRVYMRGSTVVETVNHVLAHADRIPEEFRLFR
ncbi:alanine racemase [Paenibacillus thermoaerophilus]|uniref:Alanine racemase n=1 Tax=Paenibacillus thermoaerophilus TaxID=1215385 RepID=A0ABW2V7K8_9BACL|nr:alanine racemase [Paenibacillus thermoaerophilus]